MASNISGLTWEIFLFKMSITLKAFYLCHKQKLSFSIILKGLHSNRQMARKREGGLKERKGTIRVSGERPDSIPSIALCQVVSTSDCASCESMASFYTIVNIILCQCCRYSILDTRNSSKIRRNKSNRCNVRTRAPSTQSSSAHEVAARG